MTSHHESSGGRRRRRKKRSNEIWGNPKLGQHKSMESCGLTQKGCEHASKGQGCSLHRRHVYPTLPLVHPLLSRHLCAHFQYFSPSSTVPTDSFLEITRMGGFQGVV
ncbi:hypothetical protein MPTK1_6g05280 [Marchantia polymorpha subsp. ruderalis]|uniref:Uncharacterized protein n=2 Tax=Marchantia polymorpha TaxID=3197 RepID=A0AAF6BNR6_MARPO|nr:hypothetical protein MARPO_0167s0011 [Marchantia polymorpha]BBN13650.1 hypothetical protein Mp_6g05280 [Marchantia polymorpha subsp. ruderalis]|eukprot:PTQ28319.1 hypothetical protein MARPO_0167s0011 [Marchantia polymorpha]